MKNDFDFRVGPPDDAENAAVMRIGLVTRKDALRTFKNIHAIVQEHAPDCNAKEGVGYQWQGMISLAAFSLALTQCMLTDIGWEWKNGEKAELDTLLDQVKDISQKFIDSIKENK